MVFLAAVRAGAEVSLLWTLGGQKDVAPFGISDLCDVFDGAAAGKGLWTSVYFVCGIDMNLGGSGTGG